MSENNNFKLEYLFGATCKLPLFLNPRKFLGLAVSTFKHKRDKEKMRQPFWRSINEFYAQQKVLIDGKIYAFGDKIDTANLSHLKIRFLYLSKRIGSQEQVERLKMRLENLADMKRKEDKTSVDIKNGQNSKRVQKNES
jgi:hypothetical protein